MIIILIDQLTEIELREYERNNETLDDVLNNASQLSDESESEVGHSESGSDDNKESDSDDNSMHTIHTYVPDIYNYDYSNNKLMLCVYR